MSFHQVLRETKLRHLHIPPPTTFTPSTPLREVIRHLQRLRCGCTFVTEGGKLVGVFTERDVLNKVVGKPEVLDRPVKEFMTRNPITLSTEHSVEDAIDVMSEGGYRNLPIVNERGQIVASLPASEIVNFIISHFPQDIYNLPPRPEQRLSTPDGA